MQEWQRQTAWKTKLSQRYNGVGRRKRSNGTQLDGVTSLVSGSSRSAYEPRGRQPGDVHLQPVRLGDDPVYRAGVGLRSPLTGPLPEGILCEEVCGGQFAQFSCTGPYERLGDAREKVARLAVELALAVRPDEFSVQQFVPQPGAVPADEAVTDLLVPIE
eukprot:gene17823-12772_t